MNFGAEILFSLDLLHSYFVNEIPNCFSVEPTLETQHLIRNYSLIFKQKNNGFLMISEISDSTQKPKHENLNTSNEILRFFVKLNDAYFFNYTAIEAVDIRKNIFYFSNNTASRHFLHIADFVSNDDVVLVESIAPDAFVKPFAIIDIYLNKINTQQYTIRFKEKSTYWRYLLLGDTLKELNSPAILSNGVVFKGPSQITLPNQMMGIAFESEAPIALKQRPENQYQLHENFDMSTMKGKVVIKNLPHPDITRISKTTEDKTANFSEIILQ